MLLHKYSLIIETYKYKYYNHQNSNNAFNVFINNNYYILIIMY